MNEVARAGRTVVFVSHNMAAMKSLCERVYLLEHGRVTAEGETDKVVSKYIRQQAKDPKRDGFREIHPDLGEAKLLNLEPDYGEIVINCGDPLVLEFVVENSEPLPLATVGVTLLNAEGVPVMAMSSKVQNIRSGDGPSKTWRVRCDLGRVPLNSGTFFTRVYLGNDRHDVARFQLAQTIHVCDHDVFGWGKGLPPTTSWGHCYWAPEWNIAPA